MVTRIVIGVLLIALAVNGVVMYCCCIAAGDTDRKLGLDEITQKGVDEK